MIDLNEGFHLDFETHSDINLVKVGPFVYTENWSTDVWCCGYALGEGEVKLWRPGMDIPAEYLQAYYTGRPFIAHNAGFERAVIQNIMLARYGWPMPPLNQWVCTAAMAAAMALPRALDGACKVMNLDQQKDEGGHDLMMRMARPRSRTHIPCIVCGLMACDHHDMFKTVLTWWDDEERRQRLGAYCMQDVRAERAKRLALLPLLTRMHSRIPHHAANCRSNSAVFCPAAHRPLAATAVTASISSGPHTCCATWTSSTPGRKVIDDRTDGARAEPPTRSR